MKSLVKETLRSALRALETHVREVGRTNTGVEVNRYLRAAGVGIGNPWCAAAVYTWIDDAARKLGVTNPFIRTAYCPDIGNWAKRHNILKSRPEIGDVFLVMGASRFHHTGIVIAVEGNTFRTIEGNTNTSGGREGTSVASHVRRVESRYSFVRWGDVVEEAEYNQSIRPRTRVLQDGAGRKMADLPVSANITMVPVRRACKWFGMDLQFDNSEEPPFVVDGKRIGSEVAIIDGEGYCPLRELTDLDKSLLLSFNPETQTITVTRAA